MRRKYAVLMLAAVMAGNLAWPTNIRADEASDEAAVSVMDTDIDDSGYEADMKNEPEETPEKSPEKAPESSEKDTYEDSYDDGPVQDQIIYAETEQATYDDGGEYLTYIPDEEIVETMEDDGGLSSIPENLVWENPVITSDFFVLSGSQTIPIEISDFRFWTVPKVYAFSAVNDYIYSRKDPGSTPVGQVREGNVCFILEDNEVYGIPDDWIYVESGSVRGYMNRYDLMMGQKAEARLRRLVEEAGGDCQPEELAGMAEALGDPSDYECFTHTKTTTMDTVVDGIAAVPSDGTVNIREGKSSDSRVVGVMESGDLCYILADYGNDWVFVESGDVRGFVMSDYLKTGVSSSGDYGEAEAKMTPEENSALYYTMTSVKSGRPSGLLRDSLANYAASFAGTNPENDASGLRYGGDNTDFVRSIMAEYDANLPGSIGGMSSYGQRISFSDVEPGDLVFFCDDGGSSATAVGIYIGNGCAVESTPGEGVVVESVDSSCVAWASKVVDDVEVVPGTGNLAMQNATADMYGEYLGIFKITFYCGCEKCCGKWAGGTSATGTVLSEGVSIAVDPTVIPYFSNVIINGHVFTAHDCGGAIKGNRIDIYVGNLDDDRCADLGVKYLPVYRCR